MAKQSTQLTYYGIANDLENMLARQQAIHADLHKLSCIYPSMARDERFKRIQKHNQATLDDYKSLIAVYDELNRQAEAAADQPVDYQVALATMIVSIKVYDHCKHPSDSWIPVKNVPAELRQYRQDDKDWLCAMCGELVPTF